MINEITLDMMIDFWWYGIFANMFLVPFIAIVLSVKYTGFSKRDKDEYDVFTRVSAEYIIQNGLKYRVLLRFILAAIMPMFLAYINLIYVVVLLSNKGLYSVIKATIVSNDFHIIQLVRYKLG